MPLSHTKYTHCVHCVQKTLRKYIHRKYSGPLHSYQYMYTLVSVLNVDNCIYFSEENNIRLGKSNNIKYVLKT